MTKKLLKSALIGWGAAMVLISIITGEVPTDLAGFRLYLFLTLVPGAIVGVIVAYIIQRMQQSQKDDKSSLEFKLLELKNLLDQGILTKEEFEEQKRKLLNEN